MKNKFFSEKLLLFKERPGPTGNDSLDAAMARARMGMEASDAALRESNEARRERSRVADSTADQLMQEEPRIRMEGEKMKIKGFDGTFEREDKDGKVGDLIYSNPKLDQNDSGYGVQPGSTDEYLKFAFPGETEFRVPTLSAGHYDESLGKSVTTFEWDDFDFFHDWVPASYKDSGEKAPDYLNDFDGEGKWVKVGKWYEYQYANPKLADEDYRPKMGTVDMYLKNKFPGIKTFVYRNDFRDQAHIQGYPRPEVFEPVWIPENEVKKTTTTIADKVKGIWDKITGKEE